MLETIVLGGGCFWCVESVFRQIEGVEEAISGYAGGKTKNPNYESVCSGKTGHAEVVKVSFAPDKISLEEILKIFFVVSHDPTTLNRQGNDVGTQYRSIILWTSEQQKNTAKTIIEKLEQNKTFNSPIVTQLEELTEFYAAEEYHQNYFAKHPNQPYCLFTIPPKLAKLNQKFPDKLIQ